MIVRYEILRYSFEGICELTKTVSSVRVRCREEQVRSLEGIEPSFRHLPIGAYRAFAYVRRQRVLVLLYHFSLTLTRMAAPPTSICAINVLNSISSSTYAWLTTRHTKPSVSKRSTAVFDGQNSH